MFFSSIFGGSPALIVAYVASGKMMFAGLFAAAICSVLSFTGLHIALRSPILFTAFGFVVGIAISFRMTASYNRWWEGRMQWDHLSAVSRSMARTVWLHVPPSAVEELTVAGIMNEGQGIRDKRAVIMVIRGLALALKHHLRGEREWDDPEVLGFKELVDGIGEVRLFLPLPQAGQGPELTGQSSTRTTR